MSLSKACDEYYEARQRYEDAKSFASKLHGIMEAAKSKLIDEMLEQDMRAYPRTDGTLISLRRAFHCSVTKKNQDEIREWLLLSLGDDKPFVKEVVDKAALSEKLKELVDSNVFQIDDFPAFLNVSARPDVSVRGWNKEEQGNKDEEREETW